MEHYVYVWRDASGTPFYVGKGKGRRAGRVYNRTEAFKKIHSQGGCTVEIVDEFIHESQAHAFEVELIARYGRRDFGGLLVNKTDGGEGVSGLSPNEETREKISIALTGRHLSEAHRASISAGGTGLRRSVNTRAKMSASAKNRSDQHKEKLAAANIGKPKTASHREKLSLVGRLAGPSHGFKGVSFNKETGKWRASLRLIGERKYLDGFVCQEDAARAYDDAAVEAWGAGNCFVNFPDRYQQAAVS